MERLLQFVWENRVGLRGPLTTTDGRSLRVLDPGVANTDAGPDFFGAAIELDGETWAGNVEVHTRASDWFRHGHQSDPAYASVILHVVQFDDCAVPRPAPTASAAPSAAKSQTRDGGGDDYLPQLIITVPPGAETRCDALAAQGGVSLPCARAVRSLPHVYLTEWLTALAMERLYAKSERVLSLVRDSRGDWMSASYVTLARGLGFGLNSEPFETLARNLPLPFLLKHRDNLLSLEALLIGQAGLLPAPLPGEHPYAGRLRQEYAFMARKFALRPLSLQWKMARTRPQNFPYRRLAALAQILNDGFPLYAALSDSLTADDLRRLLRVELQGYWATHYTLAPPPADTGEAGEARAAGGGKTRSTALGREQVETLALNVGVPLLHARAMWRDAPDEMTRAAELWQQLAPEDNQHTRPFTSQGGIECRDAFTSQALVQLRTAYCLRRKCIYCRFGHRMLAAELLPRRPAAATTR